MNKTKIKLHTQEEYTEFINICSRYDCDINVYDGRNVIDAKSAIGVFNIPQGKIIEVQAITPDENIVVDFIKNIRKFEV